MINNVMKTKIYFENTIDSTKSLKYIKENKIISERLIVNYSIRNKQWVKQFNKLLISRIHMIQIFKQY